MAQAPSPPLPAYELDLLRYELRVGGVPVHLERQPMELLTLLARAGGGLVSRQAIESHLWGDGVYVDAERGINNAVRKIRAALRDSPDNPLVLQTVVGKGYRLLVPIPIIGQEGGSAPVAASPVGLVAPAGLRSESRTAGRRWRGIVVPAAAGALVLGAALLALNAGGLRSRLLSPRPAIHSLAVLPLRNLSESPAQDFFAAGLTDELTTNVARLGSLRVVSATSAQQFGGAARPVPEIARALNVDAVLEGSVVRSGNKVRVTVQLIDARNDAHLWAQTYERDAGEILEIQDSIAADIATRLNARLSAEQRRSFSAHERIDPAAYEAYLRGRNELGKQRGDALLKGAQFFQQAVDAEPLYAPAYAGLADAYTLLANYAVLPPLEAFPRARAAAAKALELDPGSPEGHTALAYVKHHSEWDWAGAEQEYRRAIELNPSSPTAHLRYAEFLSTSARHSQAIQEVRLAHELSPLSLVITANIGRLLYYARRYDESAAETQKLLLLDPDRAYARIFLAVAYEQKGDCAHAAQEMRRAQEQILQREGAGMAHIYASCGQPAQARRILASLEQPSGDGYHDWLLLASVNARLGNKDRAFHWLDLAYQNRDFFLSFARVDPWLDPLRSDPRFAELLRKMNFPS